MFLLRIFSEYHGTLLGGSSRGVCGEFGEPPGQVRWRPNGMPRVLSGVETQSLCLSVDEPSQRILIFNEQHLLIRWDEKRVFNQ